MKLVPIDHENIEHAINLAKTIFPGEQHETFWPEDAYRECIANPERQWCYYIAYGQYCGCKKAFPVGITGHYIDTDGYLWVGWFGILPEYRGRNYGKQLLVDTMVKAHYEFKRRKLRLYVLCSNTAAINLYFSKGFKIIGKPRDMGDGPANLSHIMECDLSSFFDD